MTETQVAATATKKSKTDVALKTKEDNAAEQVKNKILYNLYVLVAPTLTEGDLSSLQNKITETLQKYGANIERTEKFSKCDLAYPIKKHDRVYSANIYFWVEPRHIQDIKDALDLLKTNNLLRYMLVKEEPKHLRKPRRTTIKPMPQTSAEKKMAVKEEGLEEYVKNDSANKNAAHRRPAGSTAINEKKVKEAKEKITLEDIDKRLDEIMGSL